MLYLYKVLLAVVVLLYISNATNSHRNLLDDTALTGTGDDIGDDAGDNTLDIPDDVGGDDEENEVTESPVDIESTDDGDDGDDIDQTDDGDDDNQDDDDEEGFDVTDSGDDIDNTDDGDDDDDDDDSFEVTDDAEDDESNEDDEEGDDTSFDNTDDGDDDINDDEDDNNEEDDNDDASFEATDDGEDNDEEYESDDQDDNGIPDDLDDGDLDNDDIPDDVDTDDDNDDIPDDEDDEIDWCVGIETAEDCAERHDESGDAECGYNDDDDVCYSVVRRAGINGFGSFDDGFTAGKSGADEYNSQLYTAIGILGGIIGALVIVLAGGAYYLYKRQSKHNPAMIEMIDNSNQDKHNVVQYVEDDPIYTQ